MKHLCVAGLLALATGPGPAGAATLSAAWNIGGSGGNTFGNVSLDPGNVGTAFTIEFDDLNSNALLDAGEVTTFSGLSFLSGGGTVSRDLVLHWLDIPNVSVGTGLLGNTGWMFGVSNSGTTSTFFNETFAYTVTLGQPDPDPDPVDPIPLPASAWLMLAALGGLGVMRRRAAA